MSGWNLGAWDLRRWIVVSLSLHAGSAIAIAIVSQPRFHPPEKTNVIPIQMVATSPPPTVRPAKFVPPPPKPVEKVVVQDGPSKQPEKPKPKPVEKVEKPPTEKPVVKDPKATETSSERIGKVTSEDLPVPKSELPSVDDGIAGSIELEGPPFEYGYYINAIREKIARAWTRPTSQGDKLSVKVRFRIERNGTVVDTEVLESSGDLVLDNSALRALLKASPLQPLPPAYPQDWLGVRLEFVVTE